jgi:hypothetical protein
MLCISSTKAYAPSKKLEALPPSLHQEDHYSILTHLKSELLLCGGDESVPPPSKNRAEREPLDSLGPRNFFFVVGVA